MGLSLNKTFQSGEILTASDQNASNNHLLTYIKQNKDRIVGDNAESSDVTAHDHEGTYGKVLGTDALDDLAVTTAKINDLAVTEGKIGALAVTEGKIGALAVTEGKIGADAVLTAKILDANVTLAKLTTAMQYQLYGQRVKHAELVYQTSDLVTVSFPWTEPGGTAWTNITGISVAALVSGGGHVVNDDAAGANISSTWYYVYISNSYTLAQPVEGEIRLSSAATLTGYTCIGAIYNNAAQNIEPFDQFGRMVMWRDPIKVLDAGTQTSYTDIDCSIAAPSNSTIIKLSGDVTATADSSSGSSVSCFVTKNGITPAADAAQYLAANAGYLVSSGTISITGNRDILTDGSQVIEYKVANNNASNVAATIYVTGYHVK